MRRCDLRAILCSTACVIGVAAAPSAAIARDQTFSFNIPQQNLGDALNALAQASRQQITFDPSAVQGKRNPALKGNFTAQEAIARLIQSSGLLVRVGQSGVFIVRNANVAALMPTQAVQTQQAPVSPAAPTTAPTVEQPAASQGGVIAEQDVPAQDIVVTGRAQKLYRANAISVGKMATTPLESSQSVTTITNQLIEDQGARDAQDLYRNISGVSFYSFAGVAARGFRQEEIFYDGLRGDPNAGFAVPQLFNIERVEFLKGPAGMLYGPGAPGGLFNYVTKKPTDKFSAELRAVGGTASRYGGLMEVNGPVTDGLAARGGVFYEDRGLQRNNASQQTLVSDGGVSYDAGPAKLILQATHYNQKQNAARLRGVPVDNAGKFITDREWNANEPDDFLKMTSDVLQGRVEAKPTSTIVFDATLRYNKGDESQRYHEMAALLDASGRDIAATVDPINAVAVRREYRVQFREQESWSGGANAVWSANLTESIKNRVLVGFDRYTTEESRNASRLAGRGTAVAGLPAPISLFDPVYREGASGTYNNSLPAFRLTLTDIESKRQGFYALNELTLGDLILTGGVRRDKYRDKVYTVDRGVVTDNAVFSGGATTYRFGGVYRIMPDVSLFGQYATSFEPQAAASQSAVFGGPFDPSAGNIVEGGFKTALMNGRFQTSASFYRIKRTNVLQADPNGPAGNLIAAGEVVSKGFEVDVAMDITRNWVTTLNYAFNDIRITEGVVTNGGAGDNIGDRFANAPKNKLGFWTRYQIPKLGLAAAIGGDYVSKRLSVDNQRVPPYMIFDASLIYEIGNWRAMLRVDNLLGKTYSASGFLRRTGNYPGRPRAGFLELRYLFR